MAMDFFERQDHARRKTALLLVYYILAVAIIVLAVYVAFSWLLRILGPYLLQEQFDPSFTVAWWDPTRFVVLTGATLLVILVGSIYKAIHLWGGGETIARELGGRPVTPNTTDPYERRLLNVVEEMAIASGVPVPQVFLLARQRGINAFAAGYTVDDAVIGVTQGAMELLNRDQLQGVIAHEYSHILNGDMRLNLRLVGILHGILMIALVGYSALRSFLEGAQHVPVRSGSRGRGGAQGCLVILFVLAFSVMLIAIGSIGVFCAKLIKLAVSREREYLADASAVQFTRNPTGLAEALKIIGGWRVGSRIRHARAEEASHMYFSYGLTPYFAALLSTHPPLEDRIKQLDPSFSGPFGRIEKAIAPGVLEIESTLSPASPTQGVAAFRGGVARALSQVGNPSAEHVQHARRLQAAMPPELQAVAREPYGARAIVYALLLDDDPAVRARQLQSLRTRLNQVEMTELTDLDQRLRRLDRVLRLPLLDLTIPALRALSPPQYAQFRNCIKELTRADARVSLFEYVLARAVARHLDPHFGKRRSARTRYRSLQPLRDYCDTLLAGLASTGNRDAANAKAAYEAAWDDLEIGPPPTIGRLPQPSLRDLHRALKRLVQAAPAVKKRVLRACVVCVECDGAIAVREAELLRAVADMLDCPMPPLLAATDALATTHSKD